MAKKVCHRYDCREEGTCTDPDQCPLKKQAMTELQQRIEKEAEKMYPFVMPDSSSYFTANGTQQALRNARVKAVTEWANKLEKIKEEVNSHIQELKRTSASPFSTGKEVAFLEVLSIIDKHLNLEL